MSIKLNIRKLITAEGNWKVFAHYSGDTVKSVELELSKDGALQTTYFLGNVEELDGIMEAVPESIRKATIALFK